MNPAARVLDPHTCPLSAPVPHVGGLVQGPGVSSVVIGHQVAAVQGTTCACALGLPNPIVEGSTTVKIGSMPAARVGDRTAHGGQLLAGCPTVLIGG
jgi:uncharacterized Zn-binding protein involved in type VI secretion